jgi:hypothetical protein
MESRNATNGAINEMRIAMAAVVVIVMIDAFLVIATHPTDSP